MPPLRVLIRARSPRELANYRDLIDHTGDLVPVSDLAAADVILLVVPDAGHDLPPIAVSGPPVLALLSEEGDPAAVSELEHRGISVISDSISRDQLRAALAAVAHGLTVRDPSSSAGPPRHAQVSEAADQALTPREQELLRYLGEGLGNREIAQAMGLSDHTVKFHLRSIYAKLGVRTRTEALSVAVRRGLLML
jgi:DNA-binding NarL/FixJ family response regulator